MRRVMGHATKRNFCTKYKSFIDKPCWVVARKLTVGFTGKACATAARHTLLVLVECPPVMDDVTSW